MHYEIVQTLHIDNYYCPLKIPSLTRHKPNRGWLYLLF